MWSSSMSRGRYRGRDRGRDRGRVRGLVHDRARGCTCARIHPRPWPQIHNCVHVRI